MKCILTSKTLHKSFDNYKFGHYNDMSLYKLSDQPEIDTKFIIEPNDRLKTWSSDKIIDINIHYTDENVKIITFSTKNNYFILYENRI